jgi:mono/diheme cytochrome c family protein
MSGRGRKQASLPEVAALAAAIAALLWPVNSIAQEIASRGRGLQLAKQLCAECHAVENDDASSPLAEAPTFPFIAAVPGMTPLALTAMLNTSHRAMPNILLPPEDQANLVAYILSLK